MIKKLPEINIGLIGHVDHGKTTLTQALTGKWTDTHSEEVKRGITIRLGYADAGIYSCSCGLGTREKCRACGKPAKLLRTISFVDAPGHETLMTTVLSGSAIMDGAILVISAAEKCPQPQTREHLQALDIVGIKNIIIVQNKIDLVSEEQIKENYQQIKAFLKGSVAENAPIIPISAQHEVNIDSLLETIEEVMPTPARDTKKPAQMLLARSFDVNKPGTSISKLKGGVIGGSLVQGTLNVGEQIEIRPGLKVKGKYKPVTTTILSMHKSFQNVKDAGPGGLLGMETELDPSLTKSDALVGNMAGKELPPVWESLELKTSIFQRVVGSKEELAVGQIKPGDMLILTAGIARTVGTVTVSGKKMALDLRIPICAEKGAKVALSKQVLGRWRLIGWGEIV